MDKLFCTRYIRSVKVAVAGRRAVGIEDGGDFAGFKGAYLGDGEGSEVDRYFVAGEGYVSRNGLGGCACCAPDSLFLGHAGERAGQNPSHCRAEQFFRLHLLRMPPAVTIGQSKLVIRVFELVAGEAGDAEVAAQMEQVERAEGSVDGYEIDIGLIDDEKYDSFDVGALEANPDVGVTGMNGCGVGLRGDEMLPAAVVILGTDGIEDSRIVEAGFRITEGVDGDAAQLGYDVPGFVVAGKTVGQVEHGLVEGEVGVEAGVLAESFHAAGNPTVIGISWSFGGRRWRCGLSLGGDGCKGQSCQEEDSGGTEESWHINIDGTIERNADSGKKLASIKMNSIRAGIYGL